MLRHASSVLLLAAVLAGCGGSKDPKTTTAAGPPAKAEVEPRDVRIVIGRQESESVSRPAVDPGTQRVTLVNRTPFTAVLTASNRSGQAAADVPARRSRTVRVNRDPGPDRIKAAIRFPGHSTLNQSSSIPIR